MRIFWEEQEFMFVFQGCVGFEPKVTCWQTAWEGARAEKLQLCLAHRTAVSQRPLSQG